MLYIFVVHRGIQYYVFFSVAIKIIIQFVYIRTHSYRASLHVLNVIIYATLIIDLKCVHVYLAESSINDQTLPHQYNAIENKRKHTSRRLGPALHLSSYYAFLTTKKHNQYYVISFYVQSAVCQSYANYSHLDIA